MKKETGNENQLAPRSRVCEVGLIASYSVLSWLRCVLVYRILMKQFVLWQWTRTSTSTVTIAKWVPASANSAELFCVGRFICLTSRVKELLWNCWWFHYIFLKGKRSRWVVVPDDADPGICFNFSYNFKSTLDVHGGINPCGKSSYF